MFIVDRPSPAPHGGERTPISPSCATSPPGPHRPLDSIPSSSLPHLLPARTADGQRATAVTARSDAIGHRREGKHGPPPKSLSPAAPRVRNGPRDNRLARPCDLEQRTDSLSPPAGAAKIRLCRALIRALRSERNPCTSRAAPSRILTYQSRGGSRGGRAGPPHRNRVGAAKHQRGRPSGAVPRALSQRPLPSHCPARPLRAPLIFCSKSLFDKEGPGPSPLLDRRVNVRLRHSRATLREAAFHEPATTPCIPRHSRRSPGRLYGNARRGR
jgi:hypothetical protein